MKLLFVCNQNQDRSRTAAELFSSKFSTQSAGLYNEKPVTSEQLKWADVVAVMEEKHRSEIAKRFPNEYMQKRIVSLDIPDRYHYNQTQLIEVLKSKIDSLI